MATELATAYVSLVASSGSLARSVQQEFARVNVRRAGQQAGEQYTQGMGASIRSTAGSVFTPLKVASGLLLAGTAAAAKFGLGVAAANEQASISFTTMLGSGKKAQAFLTDLKKFAAATPFEFPELQRAASSLISAGISANKVIPIMRTLGDVTAGMGTGSEGIQRATIALQQMNAAGKITGEDLNQLRDAGRPVYDLLAAATGKSKAEVTQLAAAGKLGSKELGQLMKALESGKGLERFSGLMDKQSQSLTGLLSTFKDTFGQGLADAIQPSIPLIKDGLGAASEFLAKSVLPRVSVALKEAVGGIYAFAAAWKANDGDVTSSGFAGNMERAAFFIRNVKDAAGGLIELLVRGNYTGILQKTFGWEEDSQVVDTLLGIRDAVQGVIDKFKSGDGMVVVRDLLSKLPDLIGGVSGSLPALNSAVDTASSIFGFLADHIDVVQKLMPLLIGGFLTYKALMVANNAIGRDSLIGFGLQIGSTIALTIANRQLALSNIAAAQSQGIQTGAQNVGMFTQLRMTAATIAGRVAALASVAAAKVMAGTQWLLNAALSANPIGLVVLALFALAAGLKYAWDHSETFRKIVLGAWDKIKSGVSTALNWITTEVPKNFSKLIGLVSGPIQSVLKWIQQNLIDKANSLLSKIGVSWRVPTIWTAAPIAPNSVGRMGGSWYTGGYTGDGGTFEPKGVVHGGEYVIKKDSTSRIVRDYGMAFLDSLNGYDTGGYVWPVNARPAFPWGRYPSGGIHRAYDLPVPPGTPVRAPAAGTVIADGWDGTGYGYHVRIRHAPALGSSILGHNTREVVKVGQTVAQGQVVAYSGSTGNSSGPHVHWATRWNPYSDATAFDPMNRTSGGGGVLGFFKDFIADRIRDGIGSLTNLAVAGLSRMGNWGTVMAALAKRFGTGIAEKAVTMLGLDSGGEKLRTAVYDQGGVLAPGWTMAYNGTGRNETVHTGDAGAGVTIYQYWPQVTPESVARNKALQFAAAIGGV